MEKYEMLNDENPILDTDSYKLSHWVQYPPGTTSMMSYIESRGGKFDKTLFFGLQYYLKRYMMQRITAEHVAEAKAFAAAHGEPFNEAGFMRIVDVFGGHWPVRIRSLDEGTVCDTHVPLVTIESTDPETFWAVSWLETKLLRIWYSINVATLSYNIKEIINRYLKKSSDDASAEIAFKLHDFGCRGVSSMESAMIGGAAHLVNFMGSDTIPGVRMANKYYDIDMAAFSIPATEHSSITSWGRENEAKAYENVLTQFAKPNALLACVSDSYDIYNACTNLWGEANRHQLVNSGATLVVRPDSGDPAQVVAKCLRLLDEKFGSVVNKEGYRVLQHVRILQGDGINEESIKEILNLALACGYSATNLAFGMGGALLQGHNRDTNKFAMKCCSVTVNGVEVDVFKDPITDKGKASKAGRLDTIKENGIYKAKRLEAGALADENTVMKTRYENGELFNTITFAEVRANSQK